MSRSTTSVFEAVQKTRSMVLCKLFLTKFRQNVNDISLRCRKHAMPMEIYGNVLPKKSIFASKKLFKGAQSQYFKVLWPRKKKKKKPSD